VGYFGVSHQPGQSQSKPFRVQVTRDGKKVCLGHFAIAEEAALCIARTPEGREAAQKAAAAPPLTSEEARQQAEAEGLTLLKANTKAGYFGVCLDQRTKTNPYLARVKRGGKQVTLGTFATAEEAALCIARSPEGQAAAAKKAAASPRLTSEEVGRRDARSIRRKTAPGARSAEEEEEAEAVVEVEVWEVVEAEEDEGEAEAVQIAVETVKVVEVMEPDGVDDEGGRSTGRSKKRREEHVMTGTAAPAR